MRNRQIRKPASASRRRDGRSCPQQTGPVKSSLLKSSLLESLPSSTSIGVAWQGLMSGCAATLDGQGPTWGSGRRSCAAGSLRTGSKAGTVPTCLRVMLCFYTGLFSKCSYAISYQNHHLHHHHSSSTSSSFIINMTYIIVLFSFRFLIALQQLPVQQSSQRSRLYRSRVSAEACTG